MAMRFSVPSIWLCRVRKFCPDLMSGIALDDGEQPAERAAELVLRVLEILHRLGVGEDVRRHIDLACVALARASTTSVSTVLLLLGEAFDGLDEVRNEVGTALVLVQHLRPGRLGVLLVGGDCVDAAAARAQGTSQTAKSRRGAERCEAPTREPWRKSLQRKPEQRLLS